MLLRRLTTVLLIGCVAVAMLAQSSAATKRIMDCELEAKSVNECNTNGYLYRLVYMAAPGVALGVIMLLICPFFHCCHCCGCCGCGEQSGPLSSCDVLRVKIYTLIAFLLVAASGALYGNLSSGVLTNGLLALADDAEAMPQFIQNELTRIENSMIVTRYNSSSDSFYDENLFAGSGLSQSGNDTKTSLEKSIKGVMSDFRKYVNQFAFILFLLFTIPVGIMAFGLLAAVCNVRNCLPMLVAFFFFLFGFILFLFYGVFGAVSLVLGDACAEVHGAARGEKTLLPMVTGCDNTMFSAFTDSFTAIEKSVSTSSCNQISALCYDETQTDLQNLANSKIYDCGKNFPDCDNVFFSDMVTLLDGDLYTHSKIRALPTAVDEGATCRNPTLKCSVSECGKDCTYANGTLSGPGKSSKEMFYSFKAAESVSISFDTLGGRYGSCESLFGLILGPFDSSCTAIVTGSINTREAYGWTGMQCVTAIICMIMGATKFMSFDDAAKTREPEDLDKETYEVKEQEHDTPQ